MMGNCQVRFGGGPMEKCPKDNSPAAYPTSIEAPTLPKFQASLG
jgi:hypothetical protein